MIEFFGTMNELMHKESNDLTNRKNMHLFDMSPIESYYYTSDITAVICLHPLIDSRGICKAHL